MVKAKIKPPRPNEIRFLSAEKTLDITFDNGCHFAYPAELLRVESPSAEVRGHSPDQKTIVAGRRHVNILKIVPVGHYAIQLIFDDLHDTGIYSWAYLYELGQNLETRWKAYLTALEINRLKRDP